MDDEMTLGEHDRKSEERAESVKQTVRDEFYEHIEEPKKMSTPMNIFNETPGMGAGGWGGGGLGAGLAGGVLGGLLFGNRGYGNWGGGGGGGGGGDGYVTPALLAASLADVTETQNNNTTLTQLADIKAAIPLSEAQIQLALAGNQAAITGLLNQGFSATQNQINQTTLSLVQGQNSIREAVAASGTANIIQTRDDGDRTRAAIAALAADINNNNIATLNRQLATAEAALIEQRAIGRAREVEVNVSQNVNQTQTQAQLQAQMQAVVGAVNALVANNQEVRQGIINLGTMVGNSQTAANTRVN